MEWVFVLAVVAVLAAKVWLARNGHRRRREQDRRDPRAGGAPRETPGHLPGRGSGVAGD